MAAMSDTKRDDRPEGSPGITRRQALQGIGVGLSALTVGCGSDPEGPGTSPDPAPNMMPPEPEPMLSKEELLRSVDVIVVLMMENRSFDHYLGALQLDPAYRAAQAVDGLTGKETNPDVFGNPVRVFRTVNFTPADPPHEWEDCHRQWNNGRNDGFVKANKDADRLEVMGYHDRGNIPFYYALADRYTVCSRWFASLLGPTWPNRFYLHAATAKGKRDNTPFLTGAPDTVWDRLKQKGLSGKNYAAGIVAWYTGGFAGKVLAGNTPVVDMDVFFRDARAGTLPPFSVIDPDFMYNDDHPSHHIQLGQAFMASVVQALAQSPQWPRSLLIITYDEHGGFFDHVPPPTTVDDHPGFEQLGFRVPTLAIGPTVRTGVCPARLEHVSVPATLGVRFGIASLNRRMQMTSDLSPVIDPRRVGRPQPPPTDLPKVQVPRAALRPPPEPVTSQPKLVEMMRTGQIPARHMDPRPQDERVGAWLEQAVRLGAVEIID
jgi:phospholipase C